jgi:hypothetical protein
VAKFQRVTNLRDIFFCVTLTLITLYLYAKTYEINTKALERKIQEKWRHFVQGVDYFAIV